MLDALPTDLESFLPRFGLSAFRPGQREVIEAVMSGQDCLLVMPTGGGKSLCYQLPAVAREGLTLVVSPLISLMKDQVDQLQALGLRATFINSSLEPSEQYARLENMQAGEYDLVYCAAERFRSSRFVEVAKNSRLQLLAIDEAHCISEWGHDFRPDYSRLGRARARLGNPPTIALTATATDAVRRDIVDQLALREPRLLVTGFARPNLRFSVVSPAGQLDKDQALIDFLKVNPGTGIIYVSSRKRCDEVAEVVREVAGRRAGIYHAGLMGDDRRRAQEAFMTGQVEIVVATNAFGMGIDKRNVRFVVHYNLPGTLEGYYQEAGRAGRDGLPSQCLLLYTVADRFIQEFFIESAYPSRQAVAVVYEYLRSFADDPIELTQQEIKDELKDKLNPPLSAEGIGACERLLEKAGVLERLEPRQNMALVRLESDLPTLVDLLPRQAAAMRRVLQAIERLVGQRRGEPVYFQPRELARSVEMDTVDLTRVLRELMKREGIRKRLDYVPPFRGRAIHFLDRDRRFDELEIDFETLEKRKADEYDKLERVINFARTRGCRQLEILNYFGQPDAKACDNCDNCEGKPAAVAEGWVPAPADPLLTEAVRKVLSGVARTHGKFGKQVIAQMLCGAATAKMTKFRLDRLSTYGLFSHLSQGEVSSLIDALLAVGCLEQADVERFRPVVQLTELGQRVMLGQQALAGLSLPKELLAKLRPIERDASESRSKRATAKAVATPAAATTTREVASPRQPRVEAGSTSRSEPRANATIGTPVGPSLGTSPGAADESSVDLADINAELSGSFEAEPDASPPPATASEPTATLTLAEPQPSYYWTWRLLTAGFTPDECSAIRGLDPSVVLDHALRAAEAGCFVKAAWFLSDETLRTFNDVIGPRVPERIRPLLAKLPRGTRYEEVQLFLKCRKA